MADKNEGEDEKMEELMLPGFRFHPTDEELVSFYLKRKVQHRPLSVELITQLDIYKYDPWDLPKFAMTGEKEWYFYCPRDRKYRNSTRPNRVTRAGFWKATGTDRPIYSSDGTKCIGLKKSLVFYKGRAAKGVKTDWMMHEFRLPSLSPDYSSASPKRFLHNATNPFSPNDSWAICRIFKKTNPTALRALSQSFVSSLPPEANFDTPNKNPSDSTHSCSDKIMRTSPYTQFHHENINNTHQDPYSEHNTTNTSNSFCNATASNPFSHLSSFTSYTKPSNTINSASFPDHQDLTSLFLAPRDMHSNDNPSFLRLNMSSESLILGGYNTNIIDPSIDFGAMLAQEQCPALVNLSQEYHEIHFEENVHTKNTRDAADEDSRRCETLRYHQRCILDELASVAEEDYQNLKQGMVQESYDHSLSSLPPCFSITKCLT